jgi:hypothetical protein
MNVEDLMEEAEKNEAEVLIVNVMGIWNVESVDAQPELTLVRWKIYETENRERHFVGWAVENDEGRVSSAIKSFDPKTMRGVTESGRIYQLQGDAGEDSDAEHTWRFWVRLNAVESFHDVTAQVLQP